MHSAFFSLRPLLRAASLLITLVSTQNASAEELTIAGSGNPECVLIFLAAAFNQSQSDHHVTVPPSTGTAGGLRALENRETSLARVGRPLKAEERARGLVYVSIGRDPVTFAGGAGVSITNVTVDQMISVYSGKITNWKDLGGNPGPIRAIGRESTDSSWNAMAKVFKPFETAAFGEDVKIVHLDPQMIELLDRYPGSLGLLNRSGLAAAKSNLVIFSLDGVKPTAENVKNGQYKLWLDFGLVHWAGQTSLAARSFIHFMRSPAGVRILLEQGVMPSTESGAPRS